MSAYTYLVQRLSYDHKQALALLWGFDISPFAAELAVVNLYRQDMSEKENFPRIVCANFFDKFPGQTEMFPAPRISSGTKKIPIPIPKFDCIVGNPPYLRSQNQDDLDPTYRNKLFNSATRAGILADPKTDLFAFFTYHSLPFLEKGGKLGFVTPSSWLTANYAAPLQEMLITTFINVTIISSCVESFFSQVDINTVLIVAEGKQDKKVCSKSLKFVMLKQPIDVLVEGKSDRWTNIINFVDDVSSNITSCERNNYRLKIVKAESELRKIKEGGSKACNWSKYLRAPLSYYEIFGSEA